MEYSNLFFAFASLLNRFPFIKRHESLVFHICKIHFFLSSQDFFTYMLFTRIFSRIRYTGRPGKQVRKCAVIRSLRCTQTACAEKSVFIVRKQFSNLPSVFTYPQDIFAGSFSRFVQTACRIFLQQFFLYQDNHVCQLFRYLLLLRLFQQILPDCLGSSAVFLFFRPSPFFCPLCLFFTYWSLVLCIFGGAGDDHARVKFFCCIRLIFVKKRPLSFYPGWLYLHRFHRKHV